MGCLPRAFDIICPISHAGSPHIQVSPIYPKKGFRNVASASGGCLQRHLLTRDNTSRFPASDSIKFQDILYRSTTSDFPRTQPASHCSGLHFCTLSDISRQEFHPNLTIRYRQLSPGILMHSISPNQLYTVPNLHVRE